MLFHLDKSHTAEEFSLFLTLVKSPISSLEPSTLSSSVSMSVWQKDLDLWSSEVLWKERQERLREAVKETMRQYKMACKASQKPLSLNGCFSGHKQAISFLHWQQVCVLPKITFCILKAIVQYHTEHMILADVVEAWFKSMFGRAILETEKHIYCEQSNSLAVKTRCLTSQKVLISWWKFLERLRNKGFRGHWPSVRFFRKARS